ncbi:MAG: hypothetical protein DI598_04440 [Pseudopedobacter saltans]|uniref:O-antigen polymerase n=1 Tax=Pseudopedobacter saltans TaxID=151895 RepID=A0A2W5H5T0_9SPHI|nr:MAG: hypothetical protein DI598_04440 [Pseudopedobacter saltans]
MDSNFWNRYSKPSIVKRLLLFILVFLQFYPTKFIALPVSSRVFISLLGFGLLILKYFLDIFAGKMLTIDRRFARLGFPLLLISLFSIVSLNYNGTSDTMYLYYFSTASLMILSSYFTIHIFKYFYGNDLSFEIIAYYCTIIVFFQLLFGVVTYLDPSLTLPILLITDDGVYQLKNLIHGRFMGLGASVMLLGVANGVGLLLIAILMKNAKAFGISNKLKFWLSFMFISIAVIGNMQARTTTFCAVVSIFYLIFSSLKLNLDLLKNGIGQLFKVIFFFALILVFVIVYFGDQLSRFQDTLNYGFEMFNSVSEGKGAQTGSSDMLKRMLTVWPTSTKTWLIGDGLFTTEGDGYYMQTDVGYARLIFYFGIFGAITFYIYEMMITYVSLKNIVKGWGAIWIYLLMMIFFVNVKAFIEYTHYVSLFFVFNLLYNSKSKTITIPSKIVVQTV